jgi:hypothetical protein
VKRGQQKSFLTRNNLSLRSPEGCSLARATSFDKHNVESFFNNYRIILEKEPRLNNLSRIFNLDETKTLTVQKNPRAIAPKNMRAVSKFKSQERGTLVTTCFTVRTDGNILPPVMIFPRMHFKAHMLHGAPYNTLGLANPSG